MKEIDSRYNSRSKLENYDSTRTSKRYLCACDFRCNIRDPTDMGRTKLAARGIVGKRLIYRRSDHKAAASVTALRE
jgi:hypothetical protein